MNPALTLSAALTNPKQGWPCLDTADLGHLKSVSCVLKEGIKNRNTFPLII